MQQRLALLFILGLGLAVAWLLFPYLTSLVGAVTLYVLLAPIHRRLARHIWPTFSAGLLTVATLVTLLGPGGSLLRVILMEASDALNGLLQNATIDRLKTWSIGGITPATYVTQIGDALLKALPSNAITLFGQMTHLVVSLAIAHIGLYYLLLSSDVAWRRVRVLLPFSDVHAEQLRARASSVTRAMLLGMLLTALAQGTIVWAAFLLCGLSYPVFWGVVTGFVSILPVLGSALVWLPGALVLLFQERYGAALALALVGIIIISNIDNVLRMIVYRRVSHLHPMITLVGAFAGLRAFGLMGILLGPLAISLLFELLDMYHQEYESPKGVLTSSDGSPALADAHR